MAPTAEIKPPWVQYPDTEPWWGGWRQGTSQAWLRDSWLPFWRSLSLPERSAYLGRWPPPSDDWRSYVTIFWK